VKPEAKKFAEIRNRDTGEVLVQMIGPGRDEDALSIGLRMLTHQLTLKRPEAEAGFGFGGRFGYGVDFENDTFEMHYDRQDCDCTCGATEPKHAESCDSVTKRGDYMKARMDYAILSKTDAERDAQIEADVARGLPRRMAALHACGDHIDFSRLLEYDADHQFPACSCGVLETWTESEQHARDCQTAIAERPNFTHKASGFTVRWYKYIGRDNEVGDLSMTIAAWSAILSECLASFNGQPLDDAMSAYESAEREEAEATRRAMSFWTSDDDAEPSPRRRT
jgi:hypothetical protein